jgi:excisionase family DNA binding protein
MENKLLRGEEVANQLGISKAYAYRLMASGEINVVRIGRTVRVMPEHLEDFIKGHLQTNSSVGRIGNSIYSFEEDFGKNNN